MQAAHAQLRTAAYSQVYEVLSGSVFGLDDGRAITFSVGLSGDTKVLGFDCQLTVRIATV